MSQGNSWFKLPSSFIDAIPTFESLGAIKVELVMRKLDHEGTLGDEKNAPSLADLGLMTGLNRGNVARAIRRLIAAIGALGIVAALVPLFAGSASAASSVIKIGLDDL